MKLHRFVVPISLVGNQFSIEDKEIINQVRNVLRFGLGDQIMLVDGAGTEALCKIVASNKDVLQLEKIDNIKNIGEPAIHTTLYCAILKKENFELVVQKATEIGVKEIVPVITRRTIKLDVRRDRLEKIIKEAVEQSGRSVLPVLQEPIDFTEALERARQNEVNIFFDASGKSLKTDASKSSKRVGIFIGPEGGWEVSEIESAKNHDCIIANLGALTLRAETATIIACYMVLQSY